MLKRFNYILPLIILFPTIAVAQHSDSIEPKRKGVVARIVDYFGNANKKALTKRPDIGFIGGPHYSSDTGFGIGIMASGVYTNDPTDTLLPPSNVSLYADVTTGGFYMVGLRGDNIFAGDVSRLSYDLNFSSYDTYFWGIGYESNHLNANKTPYRELRAGLIADFKWQIADNLYLGPMIKCDYVQGRNIDKNLYLWQGERLTTHNLGLGATIQFDSRDNLTAPQRGSLIRLNLLAFPRFIINRSYNFWMLEATACHYMATWKGSVLAMRLHETATRGHTPWSMMPSLGGSHTMRGYYEGRYRDKCETDATIELRQHIWRRSSAVAWIGAGTIVPGPRALRWSKVLPNYGVGYRWEFKRHSNVRLDLGFGRGEWGFVFNINEAF